MRARREVSLSLLCALLVACSAVESASPDSHPSIEGVGVLPSGTHDSEVVVASPQTVTVSAAPASTTTTTTAVPVATIGSMVTGNRLLMIGDSITASAAQRFGGELCKTLVPLGWQVEVDAEPSRFIDFGNQVLDKRLAAKWDAAYVFLGTNYLGDQQSYRKQLEKIVQRLAPTPVVLLTVTLFADSRREVNDAITLVATEFANVHVLDWGAIATANADTILRGDGHHLTNSGRQTLADNVAAVLGQAPVQPGDCLSTLFTNDSGGSVNGSDTPPPRPVHPPVTVKPPTPTTSGGGTPTSKPPSTTIPTATTTPPTQPPPTTAAPPTSPPITSPRRTTLPPPPPPSPPATG
ncbi:MAG: SGNH/GDSL hydrolase family protein [Ilumatobacteraceae bacterium]